MGLRQEDLKHTIYDIFEIDSFQSKMGDDKDIVTLSFSMREKAPADDLVKFLEGGYNFILDADVTPGEQSDGTYKVFVEMERNRNTPEQIYEILDGIKKISGLDQLKFRYYKNFKSQDATMENIQASVPVHPNDYGIKKEETTLENYKYFFNKSYAESIDMVENKIIIKKAFADPLYFNYKDFGDEQEIDNKITETFDVNGFAEILYLTKYLGDYNISKYGKDIHITNEHKTLVVERIV
jgi:hypothetical protein|tara:strand:+ start:1494 stop:2210 length:717 start_codon:yes stop_codon:yes gene_type:complete